MSNQTIHMECYPHTEKARLLKREDRQEPKRLQPQQRIERRGG